MRSRKVGDRLFHCIDIQRNRHMPAGIPLQGTGVAAVQDPVGVGFPGSQETRMKSRRHLPAGLNPDIRRQDVIEHKRIFVRGN